MRTAFAVLLMLVFLGAVILAGVSFYVSTSAIHEIEGLICCLIATICIAAWFLGAGQEELLDQLARNERASYTKPAE